MIKTQKITIASRMVILSRMNTLVRPLYKPILGVSATVVPSGRR